MSSFRWFLRGVLRWQAPLQSWVIFVRESDNCRPGNCRHADSLPMMPQMMQKLTEKKDDPALLTSLLHLGANLYWNVWVSDLIFDDFVLVVCVVVAVAVVHIGVVVVVVVRVADSCEGGCSKYVGDVFRHVAALMVLFVDVLSGPEVSVVAVSQVVVVVVVVVVAIVVVGILV